jgi:ATP-binding cassette subfamily B protein
MPPPGFSRGGREDYECAGAGIDFAYIGQILLLLAILYAVSAACSYIMGYIMTSVSIKVTYDLRKKISEKINACR